MVSFSNNQNQSILLETSNYQFPNFDGEDAFDKNWLQINIEVIDNQKKMEKYRSVFTIIWLVDDCTVVFRQSKL